MTTGTDQGACSKRCWWLAFAIGIGLAILLLLFGTGFIKSLLIGILAFAISGLILNWLWCSDSASDESSSPASSSSSTSSGASNATPSAAAPAAAATVDTADVSSEAEIKPSSELPGETELSERKGDWKYDGDSDAGSSDAAKASAPNAASAPVAAEIKPSADLPGQKELSERKGTWKYEAEPAPKPKKKAPAKKAAPARKAAPAKQAAPAAEAAPETTAADAPATLSAARAGGADDLKLIKGVGPKMEDMLNGMGFYHFDQVASWTDREVAWVDQNLKGFKGRVSRDNWVDQAKILAAGGETEFSQRKK